MSEFPPFIYCQDLGSTNGTYIDELLIGNERLVGSPRILNDGDVISIRPYWFFRFHQKLDNQRGFDSLQTKEIEVCDKLFVVLGEVARGYIFIYFHFSLTLCPFA